MRAYVSPRDSTPEEGKIKSSNKNRHIWCHILSVWSRFKCGDPPWKATTWCMQLKRGYLIHKTHDLQFVWKFQKVKGQCWNQTWLKIVMGRTSLDTASNSSGVIAYTRQFDLELVQKVQKGHTKVNIKWVLCFWCGEHLCKGTTLCVQLLKKLLP